MNKREVISLLKRHGEMVLIIITLALHAELIGQLESFKSGSWFGHLSAGLVVILVAISVYYGSKFAGTKIGDGLGFLLIIAGPLAMISFRFIRIFFESIIACLGVLQKSFIHPLRAWSARFSLANLFSPSIVPYRLYPLTRCLLE